MSFAQRSVITVGRRLDGYAYVGDSGLQGSEFKHRLLEHVLPILYYKVFSTQASV